MRLAFALATLLAAPLPAVAHPHVFIDTGLTLIVDAENRLTAIRVTWAYDELYSLLLLEERGLDPDMDGTLTEAELEALRGFDLNWVEGFEGDLYAAAAGAPVGLGPPGDPGISVEDGRIVSSHTRVLAVPAALDEVVSVKAYDPTFYSAYEVTRGAAIEGGQGCSAEIVQADLDAAYTLLEEFLYGPRSAEFDEDNFPEVGEAFADEVRVACASGA